MFHVVVIFANTTQRRAQSKYDTRNINKHVPTKQYEFYQQTYTCNVCQSGMYVFSVYAPVDMNKTIKQRHREIILSQPYCERNSNLFGTKVLQRI